MFCGLEERFVGSLWEIRVCGALEDFRGSETGFGNFWDCELGLEDFGGAWVGFAGVMTPV